MRSPAVSHTNTTYTYWQPVVNSQPLRACRCGQICQFNHCFSWVQHPQRRKRHFGESKIVPTATSAPNQTYIPFTIPTNHYWLRLQPKPRRHVPLRDLYPAAFGEWFVTEGWSAGHPTYHLHYSHYQHNPLYPFHASAHTGKSLGIHPFIHSPPLPIPLIFVPCAFACVFVSACARSQCMNIFGLSSSTRFWDPLNPEPHSHVNPIDRRIVHVPV